MKSYTDLEQSKKLAQILPLKSADMAYIASATDDNGEALYTAEYKSEIIIHESDDYINCWSLAALINVISKHSSRLEIILRVDKKYNIFAKFDNFIVFRKFVDIDNAIDVCVDMIETLHKQKLL